VPPVITQLAGVTDWIVEDGVTGRLVPPADDEALTAALRDLLINADARQRMGAAARRYVARHFAPKETAARTLDIYRELVPARRS
jgi:mannosyltransferase